MSLKNFRSYQISLKFFFLCEEHRCSKELRSQLIRSASSVTLNLAEGSAKPTRKDRGKFYYTALASLRECQANFELSRTDKESEIWKVADLLAAHLYKLTRSHSDPERNPKWSRRPSSQILKSPHSVAASDSDSVSATDPESRKSEDWGAEEK